MIFRTTILSFLMVFMVCTARVFGQEIKFEPVQYGLFDAPGALTNAWADYDNDGDLDLFVGFRDGLPNRLYRNDGSVFTDVAGILGMAETGEVRGVAWGDYDADGHIDLYVGMRSPESSKNRLYRNNGDGSSFTDMAPDLGLDFVLNMRQVCWIDYDNDRDVDLFLAVRDRPNMLLRNDGGRFKDVSRELSIDDPRRTVGAAWFDFDADGDLDLYMANQNGDRNGLYRNDGTHFTDVAPEFGLDTGGRLLQYAYGSIRPSVTDYDNDGDFDLCVVNYGPLALFRNDEGKKFINVASQAGIAIDHHWVADAWGDFNNDGRIDFQITY